MKDMDTRERQAAISAIRSELDREPGVMFAYLFGSFIDLKKFRDVDIGVYLTEKGSGGTADSLDLEQRLCDVTGLPVQVTVLNEAPITFLYHVFKGRILLSRDDEFLADRIEQVGCRYLDLEPLLRRATREAFAE